MAVCVNHSSREFKDALQKFDISEGQLENIVYEFINRPGNEDKFPSNKYIQEATQGKVERGVSPERYAVWEAKYSVPQVFSTREEMDNAVSEAKKYFMDYSIGLREGKDGKYYMTIAKPTKRAGKLSDIMLHRRGRNASYDYVRNYYREEIREQAKVAYDLAVNSIAYYKELAKNSLFSTEGVTGALRSKEMMDLLNALRERDDIVSNPYIFTLKDGRKKVVFSTKTFDEFLERKLDMLDEWSDSDLELEAVRIHNELGQEDLMYYISKKKRAGLEEQIKSKNPFITDEAIAEAIAFLDNELPNTPENNQYVDCCIRWLKSDAISLPRDNETVRRAFDLARKYKMDTSKYRHPMDLIIDVIKNEKKDITPGEKFDAGRYHHIHLNRIEQFTDKNGVKRVVEVYDVDDNKDGQQDVIDILSRTSVKVNGKPVNSPWCLSRFKYNKETKSAHPEEGAIAMWNHYNQGSRQIAMLDGIPVAFNSSNQPVDQWWDFYDHPHDTVRDVDFESTKTVYERYKSGEDEYITSYQLGNFVYGVNNGKILTWYYAGKDFYIEYNASNNNIFVRKDGDGWWTYASDTSELYVGRLYIPSVSDYISSAGIYRRTLLDTPNSVPRAERRVFQSVFRPEFIFTEDENTHTKKFFIRIKDEENPVYTFSDEFSAKVDSYAKKLNSMAVLDTPGAQVDTASVEAYYKAVSEKADELYQMQKEISDEVEKVVLEKYSEFKEANPDIVDQLKHPSTSSNNALAQAVRERAAREANAGINNVLNRDPNNVAEAAQVENVESEYQYGDDFIQTLTDEEKIAWGKGLIQKLTDAINKLTNKLFSVKDVIRGLRVFQEKNYSEAYDNGVKRAINQELNDLMDSILQRYHFDIVREDLTEAFGEDVLGAFDVLQKIIYLSNKGDRGAIVDAEEFSHAFIKMMGSVYHRPENRAKHPETKLYSELRDEIEKTDFYKSVYDEYKNKYVYYNGNPDTAKIKEEALGKALAATIIERYDAKTEADKSFFAKLKKWFNDVLLFFKSKITDYGKLEKELNDIADHIIEGDYARKYLNKIDDTGFRLQTVAETLQKDVEENNGLGLAIMNNITNKGGIVTGSVSFRDQGTVYRKDSDSLHDIDSVWTEDVTHFFRDNPQLRAWNNGATKEELMQAVLSNPVIASFVAEHNENSEAPMHLVEAFQVNGKVIATFMATPNPEFAQRFSEQTGPYSRRLEAFSEEERKGIHLIDMFLQRDSSESIMDEEHGIRFANYKESFREKLKFGRAKDLYDYQNFNPYTRVYAVQRPDATYQESTGIMYHISEKIRPETQDYFDKNRSVVASMNNLYKETALTANEIREEGVRTANWLSDMLTEYQKNPEAAIRDFNITGVTPQELSSLSRRELLIKINLNNLIEYYKSSVLDSVNNELLADAEDELLDKVDLIKDNLNGILQFGVSTFRQNEKFGFNLAKGDVEKVAETQDEFEELTGEDLPDDGDTTYENDGSEQERWQVENNTMDVLYNATEAVRAVLNQAYIYDKDGNIQRDYLGRNQRLTAKEATASILKWVDGAFNLDMMVAKLQEQQGENTWLAPLVQRLSDKTGNESDFQSQFFTTMYKPFMSYSVGIKDPDTGMYYVKPLNEKAASSEVMRGLRAKYNMGAFPLVGNFGVIQTALGRLTTDRNTLDGIKTINDGTKESAISAIEDVSIMFGYHVDPDVIRMSLDNTTFPKIKDAVSKVIESLNEASGNEKYNPLKYGADNGISGYLTKFYNNVFEGVVEDILLPSVYSGGKMRQSYITPSYAMKLMSKLRGDQVTFENTIKGEFGYSEWFVENTGESFEMLPSNMKNLWLKELMKMTEAQRKQVFKHHNMPEFDKSVYMKGMSSEMYALSALAEYFSLGENKKGRSYAYYRVPLLSNKPSAEYISFIRYTGKPAEYQRSVVNGMMLVYDQELSRIQTVRKMNKKEGDYGYINNFSKRGKDFVFLDFLNEHLNGEKKSGDLGKLLNAKIEGRTVDNNKLYQLVSDEIYRVIGEKADKFIENYKANGIFEAAKKVSNLGTEDSIVEEKLREFYWNDALAEMNITQLFVTDLAFYKDTEDVQKRMAQIHSPGMRGNVSVLDYDRNPVTDGRVRTVYLSDYTTFVSNVIDNIAEVFDRKIAQSTGVQKENYIKTKEQVIKAFSNNDVANAQAFFSPTSARKFGYMFGTWNKQSEALFKKLRAGEANLDDINTVFQPMKPFVYSQIAKPVDAPAEAGETPIKTFKVPVQNKNAQYLLVMADALLKGEKTSKPNLLRALFEVMEDSATKNPARGIDVIQFESAVKSGLVGKQDLNQFIDIRNDGNGKDGYTLAKEYLEGAIYTDTEKTRYDPMNVQELMAEDFSIQHYTPEHFMDASAIWGSQIRAILQSNLDGVDADGNPVMYEFVDDATGETKRLSAKEFRDEYERTAAALVNTGINDLVEEFGIDNPDFSRIDRNVALARALQDEILKSSRYSTDLWLACAVDEETGKFRIPLGDPIQSTRIEQLVNSIIKNRVNKVKIAGGPLVQVTAWGMPRQPEIVYDDKGGILHYECYAPAWTKELYKDFMNAEGGIDIESLEMLEPKMLELLGYRLPSEDKFSAAPFKIIGFLPKEAGDGFMGPYEWTTQTGSDFDDDKARTMRMSYHIVKNKISLNDAANKIAFRTDLPIKQDKKVDTLSAKKERYYIIYDILKNGIFKDSESVPAEQRELFKAVKKAYLDLRFTVKKPTEGREYLANKMVAMSLAVMKNANTASQIQVPQGFEKPKRVAYMATCYKLGMDWEDLSKMSTDELKSLAYRGKNIMFFDVQQQFYKQNAAAGQILGMFAVQKSAHALLSENNYAVYIDKDKAFTIAGKEFAEYMIMDQDFDDAGEYIGRSLGSLVGGSADAVKDPIFNLMNVNNLTAGALTTLIRLGMPIEEACLYMSADIITKALNLYNSSNLANFMSFDSAVEKLMQDTGIESGSQLDTEELTKDEMIKALREDSTPEINYKVLLTFQKIQQLSRDTKPLTAVTRYNSMASAVGPKIVNSIIQQERLNVQSDNLFYLDQDGNAEQIGPQDILDRHPLLYQFSRTYDIAKKMLGMMPAYSEGFKTVMNHMHKSSTISDSLKKTFMNDAKLLESLLEFYESYALVKAGVINPANKDYFMNEFAQDFQRAQVKKRYADNPFVQAIKIEASRFGKNKGVLTLDTAGMDTLEKERLMSGWAQLQRENPELSRRLFEDNFFRGGLGYTPKTYTNITPIQVKEGLAGYSETFEHMPEVSGPTVVDLFVRNNASNFKLAPRVDTKEGFTVMEDGNMRVTGKGYTSIADAAYFRVRKGREDTLYRAVYKNQESQIAVFEPVSILGNNGEYIDFVGDAEAKPAVVGQTSKEDVSFESEASVETTQTPSEEEHLRQLKDLYESATGRTFQEATSDDIVSTLKEKGIDVSAENIEKIKELYC